jgi:hypothetical protein
MSDVKRPDEGSSPEECVVGAPDDGTDGLWDPFDAEHDVELQSRKVTQEDGMPGEVAPDASDDIPPLSRENMICMGVFDSFVIRDDWGDVVATFDPDLVFRSLDGRWRIERNHVESVRDSLRQTDEAVAGWLDVYMRLKGLRQWVEVEPVRPPCKFYLRQAMPYDKNPRHKKFFRLCSLRRTTEGAMMSVGDTAVWACEGRDPRHAPSEGMLERFDEEKIKLGRERTKVPIVATEPEDEKDEPVGGIFRSKE